MRKIYFTRTVGLLTLFLLFSGPIPGNGDSRIEGLAGPASAPAPVGTLRVVTWNVAHGRADTFHQSLLAREVLESHISQIADVLRHEHADLVALQEADGPSAWSGGFDHVSTLAQESGLGHFYRGDHNPLGPLFTGTALVSRYPLADPASEAFAMSLRDTKGFVRATVRLPGTDRDVDVVSVHLDFLLPAERERQVLAMVDELAGSGRPLVVLGDFNAEAAGSSAVFTLLAERLGLRAYRPEMDEPTYPTGDPARRIDWILASPELEFVAYRTLAARLSDHLGVVADLRLRATPAA